MSGMPCLLAATVMFLVLRGYDASCLASTTGEISHLLSFIEQSECIFIRNGKEYNARKAKKHIEKKYDHLRHKISSAEEFILFSASRSSISNEPYSVICNNREMKTADWLKTELANFRARELPEDNTEYGRRK
ncbi:MAG: DUF5329 domain-containing protein [Desulfobulbaceae bacterium]|nr:DUF5329 domain-containing protein [Desulfobulbaceae bacterium]